MRMIEHARRAVSQAAGPPRTAGGRSRARIAPPVGIGNQATQRLLIQTKLTVSQPGDRLEREADRVADAVMRTPAPSVQRMCTDCEEELHRSPARTAFNTEPEEEGSLQTDAVPGGGRPLAPSERTFFEPRFGRDFGDVRIHADARAAESAGAVHALAYTLGRDIVFGAGHYAPGTDRGRRLIGHELTHVVQQGGGGHAEPGAARAASATSSLALQRMGDPSQAPTDLGCPIAISTPAHVVTDVLFGINSSALTATAVVDIATLVGRWRAAGANRSVRVDGYASVDGPDPLNWRLSCARAKAVVAELKSPPLGVPGIPDTFIELFAQGETSEFGAALPPNRRATISADLAPAPLPVCANPGEFRTLDLQPIFLRTDPTDAAPTGASWTRRLDEANVIWGKVGVTFNDLGAITLDTPLKTGGTTDAEIGSIAALRTGAGVEVFPVDNDMVTSGGASTLGPLAALCDTGKIVMSDRGTSDTLLAHELGHILGIQHPGTPPNPGDPGTIMVGTGSNSVDNSTRNTLVNFNAILCPPAIGSTCLHPDP